MKYKINQLVVARSELCWGHIAEGDILKIIDINGYSFKYKTVNLTNGHIDYWNDERSLEPLNLIDNQYVFPFMFDE